MTRPLEETGGGDEGERRRAAVVAALELGDDPCGPDPNRIYDVDPRLLLGGPNVRGDLRPDPAFTDSLLEHGVLEVITCYLRDGELVVYRGRRRSYFAAQAGLATVPLRVIDRPGEVDRIVRQCVENDKRADLSALERAGAVEQLVLLDVPVGQIGRRLAMRRGEVDTALAVARSRPARAAAAEHDLTLAQAAAVAEVGDDPAAVAQVIAAAADPDGTGGVEHVLERVRDERRDAADRATAAARLRATGVQVLDERPDWTGGARLLADLHLPPAEHTTCRGHAAYLVHRDGVVDGHRTPVWEPEWVCTDPKAYGHGGKQVTLDDATKAADRAERDRCDRDWRTAQRVRRRWIADLAQRTTPPVGAERWILATLLSCEPALLQVLTREDRHQTLRDILGLDHGPGAGIAELTARAGHAAPPRAVLLTVVLLCAALDDRLGRLGPGHAGELGRTYLAQLRAWGYPLAPVERRLIDT